MRKSENTVCKFFINAWADPEGGGGGGGGQGVRSPPEIARLLIFAMLKLLKFSVRPLLGIWSPPPENFLDPRMYMVPTTNGVNMFLTMFQSYEPPNF